MNQKDKLSMERGNAAMAVIAADYLAALMREGFDRSEAMAIIVAWHTGAVAGRS